jgi:hypothetical protein
VLVLADNIHPLLTQVSANLIRRKALSQQTIKKDYNMLGYLNSLLLSHDAMIAYHRSRYYDIVANHPGRVVMVKCVLLWRTSNHGITVCIWVS